MEDSSRLSQKKVLSPEPKRFSSQFLSSECAAFTRSYSCNSEDQFVISELSSILSNGNFPSIDRNSSPLFSRFSQIPPERSRTNPIIFDEKFAELEYSLSTSEDSGSDCDVMTQNN